MAKRIIGTTPKQDGYRMPAEFEPQQGRVDALARAKRQLARRRQARAEGPLLTWQKPSQNLKRSRSAHPCASIRTRAPSSPKISASWSSRATTPWVRDCGPTFLVNDKGGLRAVDWEFNAWGGLVDGLYFPWDKDDQIARKICEIADVDSYRTEGFVLEGGSIHVDGEGTVLTTEMCLLSEGRNPDKSKEEIEQMICDYLGCEKVLWIKGRHRPRRDERAH